MVVLSLIIYLVVFLLGYSMPLKKKNTAAQVGSGEDQQVEVSVDHVSMHTEGIESYKDVKQPSNRDLMATIEDFQHSQATMWVEL